MKKIFCMLCALALTAGACAVAEEGALALENGTELKIDQKVEMDLDGDGAPESVLARMKGVEDERTLEIVVTGTDGAVCVYGTDLQYVKGMYATDLDGDGKPEILLSGDLYSDDYYSWCLRYDGDQLNAVQFADANREENTDGYFDCGYGMITAIDGNELTMTGSQDVLGTWMASRVFTLKDGRFELEDGGLWKMETNPEDADTWAYRCLTLTQNLPVEFEDGAKGELEAGDQLIVTQSDKTSIVYFQTRDGRRGHFPIEPDVENGWGSRIYGASEYDYFEYVPYAD